MYLKFAGPQLEFPSKKFDQLRIFSELCYYHYCKFLQLVRFHDQTPQLNSTCYQHLSNWGKCTDMRSWSRVLAIACCPFHKFWNWKLMLQMNLISTSDKSKADSCFVLWVLISGVHYFVTRSSSVCFVYQNPSRTFPERLYNVSRLKHL